MKIAITGATGFVGRLLVPKLLEEGATILGVGRKPWQQGVLPSAIKWCSYEDIPVHAQDCDLLVHLAVLNNDSGALLPEFERVNVDLTLQVAELAQAAGIRKVINVSSIHALDPRNLSFYATTKREAARQLKLLRSDTEICTFFLPAVTGEKLAGKLSILNRLPTWTRRLLLYILRAMRPTVRIDTLAKAILSVGGTQLPLPASRILSDGQQDNVVFLSVKRGIDLLFVVIVIGLFWWGMLIIYCVVRVQSAGPGIFAQSRVGKSGREFVCYKFRTMYADTPNVGTHAVARSAVTPLGQVLRKTKLDELPQIWNILRNEMSLIGPRPCLPSQEELIKERRSRGVLEIKPGISGYAQVNGIDMSEPALLAKWDARYVRLQSLLLDLRIILSTLLGRGGGDRVR